MNPRDKNAKRRLRIAVFNRNFCAASGGAERYSVALVERLAAQYEIHVFAQRIEHEWQGVTYHRIPHWIRRPRWVNQGWYATATWWATRHGFDWVLSHENTWHGQIQTVHVAPVKYSLFHGLTGWRRWWRWVGVVASPRLLTYLWLEWHRYAQRPGRTIVATSSRLREQIEAAYPEGRAPVEVITPGVDVRGSPATWPQKLAARQSLGLPEAGQCILFVGNDYRKKGLATLLAALAKLPEDYYVAVVGNPDQTLEFAKQAQDLRQDHRVFFLGSQRWIGLAYTAADCLVHPTLEDTFGMVVLEAMAYGLPVVVSDQKHCGIASLLDHRVNAYLLEDPRDATTLAHTIEPIFGDLVTSLNVRDAARAFAMQYDWSETAAKYRQLFENGGC